MSPAIGLPIRPPEHDRNPEVRPRQMIPEWGQKTIPKKAPGQPAKHNTREEHVNTSNTNDNQFVIEKVPLGRGLSDIVNQFNKSNLVVY